MDPYRLFLPLLLAAVAVAGGASSARADGTCRDANVVFYTTDTQDLSRQLAAARSSCADWPVRPDGGVRPRRPRAATGRSTPRLRLTSLSLAKGP